MRLRLLLIAAILLLAIPLGFLLRDVAREVFLLELLRTVRAARLLFASVAQTNVWIGFLVAALLLALASLIRPGEPRQQSSETVADRPGPIEGLGERIENSTDVHYLRRRLAHELRNLTLDVLAHQHRTTAEQMRQRLRAGTLAAPQEIQAYLLAQPSQSAARSRGMLSKLRQWLSPSAPAVAPDPKLEQVVQFLESQVMHDPARDRATPSNPAGHPETSNRSHLAQGPHRSSGRAAPRGGAEPTS